jgi:hypothetical protein
MAGGLIADAALTGPLSPSRYATEQTPSLRSGCGRERAVVAEAPRLEARRSQKAIG